MDHTAGVILLAAEPTAMPKDCPLVAEEAVGEPLAQQSLSRRWSALSVHTMLIMCGGILSDVGM